MSKDKGASNEGSALCIVEKCGKRTDRMNFCTEHYAWFKEGLINKKGVRPSDFDKKFQAYSTRTKKKPA